MLEELVFPSLYKCSEFQYNVKHTNALGIEKYGCADDPNLLLCVSGVAGVGKSAVLASAASKLMQVYNCVII